MPVQWTAHYVPLDVPEILRTLHQHGVEHVVVGGVAALFHGYAGATFDADVVPAPDDDNLRRLAAALRDLEAKAYANPLRADLHPDGAPPEADLLDLESPETLRRSLAWFFSTRAGLLDVLLVIDGAGGYASIAPSAVRTSVGGHTVRIISLDDLIEAKETAGREKDLIALRDLRRLAQRRFEPPHSAS